MFKEQFNNQRGWLDGKFIDICCCHCCHQQIRMLFTRPRFPVPSSSSTHPSVTADSDPQYSSPYPLLNIRHPVHSWVFVTVERVDSHSQTNSNLFRQMSQLDSQIYTAYLHSAIQCYRYSTNHCEKCDPSIIIIYRARKKDIHKCMGPCVWIVQIWWSHVLIYLCPCLPCPGLHLPRRIILCQPISMAISRLSKNETKTLYNC